MKAVFSVRHGSNALDSSSPTARSNSVILSASAEALSEAKGKDLAADHDKAYLVILSEAKDLCADHDRPFAEFTLERSEGLRMTRGDGSSC